MNVREEIKISRNKIIKATLDGIETSVELYQKWSGGEWVCNAPEYLLTVKIAESIAIEIENIGAKELITLEDNLDYLLGLADAKGKGSISNKVRKNGRCDISVWREDEKPKALIEVKNSVFSLRKITSDINRIKEVLKRKTSKSTFEFGLIAFYIDRHYESGNAKNKIREQAKKIFEQAKNLHKDINFKFHYREETTTLKDTDAWASVVFEITRNANK